MGAFTLILDRQGPGYEDLELRQLEAMAAQGFSAPTRLVAGSSVLFAYPKLISPTVNIRTFTHNEFVAVFGTFYYRGKTGAAGLDAIYEEFENPATDSDLVARERVSSHMRGTYACVIYKGGHLYAFTDRLALYKVYLAEEGRIVTSSLLTAVACTDHPRLYPQGVFEYVFQGATYGGDTPVSGIRLLDPDIQLKISGRSKHILRRKPLAPATIERGLLTDHCRRIHRHLSALFGDCNEAYESQIDTALSGGYDSRLILAHLLSRDTRPAVHVYGTEGDDDVRIAKMIAKNEGFELTHIDKSRFGKKLKADERAKRIEKNFYVFDGLPVDGIFDNGIDLVTREDRARHGRISLNGGGGEIFRNFFYLRDRRYSALEIVSAFYSRFSADCFAPGWDPAEYRLALAKKINESVAGASDLLSRAEVERVFPLFRCRYWMGKNNSVNNRLGLMHTPFVEPLIVESAGLVPIGMKDYGRLAGCLIRMISPQLAAYQSAYGHAFDGEIPRRQRAQHWLSCHRAPAVRRLAFPLRERLNRKSLIQEKQHLMLHFQQTEENIAQTRSIIRFDRILDPGQVRRLFTLEYFCRKTGTIA
jgi:asparagine synthase (glutamine-hydrolysing)